MTRPATETIGMEDERAKAGKLTDRILRALRCEGMSLRRLAATLGAPSTEVIAAVQNLFDDGLVAPSGDKIILTWSAL